MEDAIVIIAYCGMKQLLKTTFARTERHPGDFRAIANAVRNAVSPRRIRSKAKAVNAFFSVNLFSRWGEFNLVDWKVVDDPDDGRPGMGWLPRNGLGEGLGIWIGRL